MEAGGYPFQSTFCGRSLPGIQNLDKDPAIPGTGGKTGGQTKTDTLDVRTIQTLGISLQGLNVSCQRPD